MEDCREGYDASSEMDSDQEGTASRDGDGDAMVDNILHHRFMEYCNLPKERIFCRDLNNTLQSNVYFQNRGTSSTRLNTITASSEDASLASISDFTEVLSSYDDKPMTAHMRYEEIFRSSSASYSSTSRSVVSQVRERLVGDDFDMMYFNQQELHDDDESVTTVVFSNTSLVSYGQRYDQLIQLDEEHVRENISLPCVTARDHPAPPEEWPVNGTPLEKYIHWMNHLTGFTELIAVFVTVNVCFLLKVFVFDAIAPEL